MTKRIQINTNNKTFNYKIEMYTCYAIMFSITCYADILLLRNDRLEFNSIRHTCILH